MHSGQGMAWALRRASVGGLTDSPSAIGADLLSATGPSCDLHAQSTSIQREYGGEVDLGIDGTGDFCWILGSLDPNALGGPFRGVCELNPRIVVHWHLETISVRHAV